MPFRSGDEFLAHVLQAFRPYLDTLVLIGGFAVRLYELHPRARSIEMRVLRTLDADFATPPVIAPHPSGTLAQLADAAGFQPDLRSEYTPPVMKLVPRNSTTGPGAERYTVEFLTPLAGRSADRAGTPLVTVTIQAGLTAQRLRYLDLMQIDPWQVSVGNLSGVGTITPPLNVRVPHPGFFIIQKILIADRRDPETERPKDMAYIYQVVNLFSRELSPLASDVRVRMQENRAWNRWFEESVRLATSLFATPSSPGVVEAHRALTAELAGSGTEAPTHIQIHAGIQAFLGQF
jgi:hypothetical protein